MRITLAENGTDIRRAFVEKHTMPWPRFLENHRDWVKFLEDRKYPVRYEDRFLWELMDYPTVPFDQALALLRSMEGDVFFMSEGETSPHCHGLLIDGKTHKGGVAKAKAAALSDLIGYEWYEQWRLSAMDSYLADRVLPDDLYVFDTGMERLLVFTHENDFWDLELEQPMKAAASRFCKMYGFDASEDSV